MRTSDFTKTPKFAQSESMFYGATRYKLRGLVGLPIRWVRLRLALRKAPGFVKLLVWYRFPTTIGSVVFFDTQDNLMLFARTPEHKMVMRWVGDEREVTSDAGFIRIYNVLPIGYANGRWSPEDKMGHIETFSHLSHEEHPPKVDD